MEFVLLIHLLLLLLFAEELLEFVMFLNIALDQVLAAHLILLHLLLELAELQLDHVILLNNVMEQLLTAQAMFLDHGKLHALDLLLL
jgi:hypothetical protein